MSTHLMHESPRRRLWMLVVLGSLTMFSALATDMYLPAFPQVADTLGVRTAQVQLTLTTFLFGMGVGQGFYGPLSDRFGRKPPLLAGIALFGVASLLCATATTLPSLLVWRFLQALGGSAGIVIARAIVRDSLTGIELARTMTAMGAVFAFAPAIAPSAGALILVHADWTWIFIALACFGVYAIVGTLTLAESHPEHRRTDHGVVDALRAYLEIARSRDYRFSVGATSAAAVTLFGFIASSPGVLIGEYGVSTGTFALLFGLNSLAMVVASQVNVRLLPAHGVRGSLLLVVRVQIAAALGLCLAVATHAPLPVVLVCTAVATGAVSTIFGNSLTLALMPFGHLAGSATALSGLIQTFAGAIAAALLSQLPGPAATHMAGAILVGSTMAYVFARGTREHTATAH